MSDYPYVLDQPCPVCKSPIIITRKRKRIPTYCSVSCYNSTIQKYPNIVTDRTCPQCNVAFRHHRKKYCSKKCANRHNARPGPAKFRNCLCCKKDYELKKSLGNSRSKYCSNACFTKDKITKHHLKLDSLTTNFYLLGQIWATALIKNLLEIRLYSSLETLESCSQGLSSSYKITSTRSELWDNYFITSHAVTMYNRELVSILLDLGISDPPYREWPIINPNNDLEFLRGYLDSVRIVQKESERWVWMVSRSMAYETEAKFGGRAWYELGDWWWISKLEIT